MESGSRPRWAGRTRDEDQYSCAADRGFIRLSGSSVGPTVAS